MKEEPYSCKAFMYWIAKLTMKISGGKIISLYQGEDMPQPVVDHLQNARAIWMVALNGSRFEVETVFGKPKVKESILTRPAHCKKRLLLPCPLHAKMDKQAQADVMRRGKLAQCRDVEVKWVDGDISGSMIIVNPPTINDADLDDGLALIDLCLPQLDTSTRAKFEITQKQQVGIFSDLVKSFSLTWGKAHHPSYESQKEPDVRPVPVLQGLFVV